MSRYEREMKMHAWLKTHEVDANRRYVAYVRKTVNDSGFSMYSTLYDWFEWCMENFDKPEITNA